MTTAAEYSRRYRERHPDRYAESQRRYREKNPRTYENVKAANDRARRKKIAFVHSHLERCVDCGNTDRRVLEWDHVRSDGTPNCSPSLLAATAGYERIKREIAKCEVRCANCHSIRHYEERHAEDPGL